MLDKSKYFQEKGDHADEMETSLMLYIRPDLVLPKTKWGSGEAKRFKIKVYTEGWVWAERKWSKVTIDTGVGNPKYNDANKGEKFFKDICGKMSDLFNAL